MQERITLPGTTIQYEEGKDAAEVLDGLFNCGGLVLSQVTQLTGLNGYMVQNWVKRGYMTPTVGKRYSKNQFCRLVLINLLRDSLSLKEITGLLSYINGRLDDESDDMIDDALLYVYFVRTIRRSERRTAESARRAAEEVTLDYAEPREGGRNRLVDILSVMYVAYISSVMLKNAKEMLSELSL